MIDAETYSNDILESNGLQSTEDFDLLELERLCQPHYAQIAQIVWDYTIAHSKPGTED